MSEGLRERIAAALGWTLGEVGSFSAQTLREVVRPVSPKLAHELDLAIQGGAYITANQPKPKRRRW